VFCNSSICQYLPNFRVEKDVDTNHLYTDRQANECLTTLSLTIFTQRNFVADIFQAKCDFTRKTAVLHFEPPFGGLEATYDVHLRLIGKRVLCFLLVLLNFFATCYHGGATSEYRLKTGDFAPTGLA